jgi:hypothetical protein
MTLHDAASRDWLLVFWSRPCEGSQVASAGAAAVAASRTRGDACSSRRWYLGGGPNGMSLCGVRELSHSLFSACAVYVALLYLLCGPVASCRRLFNHKRRNSCWRRHRPASIPDVAIFNTYLPAQGGCCEPHARCYVMAQAGA